MTISSHQMHMPSPAFEQDYILHDQTTIRASGDDASIKAIVDLVLRYLRAVPVLASSPEPHIRMTFGLDEGTKGVPEDAAFIDKHERGVAVLQAGPLLYLRYEDSWAELDPATGVATFHLQAHSESEQAARRGLLFDFMVLSLLSLLRTRGLYMLHAAALVHEETGYLISAASGSGKSTLAMSLVRQGWAYLSDDMVLLHHDGDQVETRALGCHFRLSPEATRPFPELRSRVQTRSTVGDKLHLEVDALYPGQFVAQSIPSVLIIPEIVETPESTLQPLDTTSVLLHLLTQTTLLSRDTQLADQHLSALRCLVNQVKTYRLLAGRDLYNDPSRCAILLAPLA